MAATLLIGLKDDSRVKMHFSKARVTLEQSLLAIIADRLDFLSWTKTKDAQKGHKYNKKTIFDTLTKEPKKKEQLMSFDTPEEYDRYMQDKRRAQ